MNAYYAVYLYNTPLGVAGIPYGPYASEAAAQAWIATQQQPANYQVAQGWATTVVPPATTLACLSIAAGQYTVMNISVTFSGTYFVALYGSYATQALAQAYAQTLVPPTNYSVVQVVAPPS